MPNKVFLDNRMKNYETQRVASASRRRQDESEVQQKNKKSVAGTAPVLARRRSLPSSSSQIPSTFMY